jgi:hypothetical protein
VSDGQIDKVADVRLATQRHHAHAERDQERVLPVRRVGHAERGVPLGDGVVGQLDHHLIALLLALDRVVGGSEVPIGVAVLDLDPVLLATDRGVRLPRGEVGGQGDLAQVLLRRDEGPDELALGVADDLTSTDVDVATHGDNLLKACSLG